MFIQWFVIVGGYFFVYNQICECLLLHVFTASFAFPLFRFLKLKKPTENKQAHF